MTNGPSRAQPLDPGNPLARRSSPQQPSPDSPHETGSADGAILFSLAVQYLAELAPADHAEKKRRGAMSREAYDSRGLLQ